MTLTDREMVIAKLATLGAAAACGVLSEQEALDKIKEIAGIHGYSFNDALTLQNEIDDMLKDATRE